MELGEESGSAGSGSRKEHSDEVTWQLSLHAWGRKNPSQSALGTARLKGFEWVVWGSRGRGEGGLPGSRGAGPRRALPTE